MEKLSSAFSLIRKHIRCLIPTHNFFASRDMLFNKHVNEFHKEENYDALHIPHDYVDVKKKTDDKHK